MRISLLRRLVIHLCVFVAFAVLAIAWTFPLVQQLSTHLPGAGIGDNAMFLWNFWWMRESLAAGYSFFHTTYLFAPAGADLTLNTHTALPAFLGATLFARLNVVAAMNVTVLASLALNGFAAYLLAWRTVRQLGAAVLAGVIFGTSPYIAAHLNGHFNLIAAWTIPLFAMCLLGKSRRSCVLAGLVLAVTAYVDYYYLVYELALAAVVLVMNSRRWRAEFRTHATRPALLRALVVLIGLDVLAIVVTLARGKVPFNPAQLLSVLTIAALWVRFGPRVSSQRADGWSPSRALPGVALMLGVFLAGIAPLLRNAARLIADGQYVTQHYQWRNAPIGVDALTLFIGNPFHGLWGAPIARLYGALGIDLIESGAWLGIVPVALTALVIRRRRSDAASQLWIVLGGVFFVWALGSHIHAIGFNTGLITPEVLLRYVPIASNARMPGRAIVIVYLALAMLAAMAVAHLKWRRPAATAALLCALVLADFWIAPFPTVAADCPPIYQMVRDLPQSGALAELPLGISDGFGAMTVTDNRVLVCQSVHGRPITGGAVARLPPAVLATYRADPLLAAWLRLSGAQPGISGEAPLPDAAVVAERLAADRIAFVMLDRRTASPALRDFVERAMGLTVVTQDSERTLFRR